MRTVARAKINWTLEVLGTRPDGYHELRSVVLLVALHDDVEIEPLSNGEIAVEGCAEIPLEKNLAYIAAVRLREHVHRPELGAAIRIVKRIPSGAGLGGGSSDAAAVLRLLNVAWKLNLEEPELCEVGSAVGSDVPVLVLDAPAMMEGRGERVRRLSESELAAVPEIDEIELYTPPVFSSTAAVYGEFRETDRGYGRNDLQPAALRLYPAIADALALMERRGFKSVAMSGSGSTVYGIRGRDL